MGSYAVCFFLILQPWREECGLTHPSVKPLFIFINQWFFFCPHALSRRLHKKQTVVFIVDRLYGLTCLLFTPGRLQSLVFFLFCHILSLFIIRLNNYTFLTKIYSMFPFFLTSQLLLAFRLPGAALSVQEEGRHRSEHSAMRRQLKSLQQNNTRLSFLSSLHLCCFSFDPLYTLCKYGCC